MPLARKVSEPPPATTVAGYLQEWLSHMRGRVRPRTWEGYEALVRIHAIPGIGAVPLLEVHPLDLQRLYGQLQAPERGLSGGTVLNLHLVLTQALGQAQRWGLIPTNPANGAQPPGRGAPSRRSSTRRSPGN
jgi:integrase